MLILPKFNQEPNLHSLVVTAQEINSLIHSTQLNVSVLKVKHSAPKRTDVFVKEITNSNHQLHKHLSVNHVQLVKQLIQEIQHCVIAQQLNSRIHKTQTHAFAQQIRGLTNWLNNVIVQMVKSKHLTQIDASAQQVSRKTKKMQISAFLLEFFQKDHSTII